MRSISSVSIPLSIPRSIPIPIQKSPTNSSFSDNTYILKQNSFDPTKSSPPNDFMIKLTNRLNSMK
jgi:hypothetical protein